MNDPRYLKLFNELKEDPTKKDQILNEIKQNPETPYDLRSEGRSYKPKSTNARIEQYRKNKALRAKMLENRVPFIHPEFDPDFFLCQGMTIVCAMSGQSKSTTCANVIAGFINHTPGKQIVVITNEEGPDAVIDRVACLLHEQNYIDLYKNRMSEKARALVEQTSIELSDFVEVVDDPAWDMGCLEDVQSVLEHAAKNGVSLVILDYLQTVTYSRDFPHLESFQVSKKLGLYLKDYGKRVGVPVVVFAQLSPPRDKAAVQDRIQNDKTIYNHAFNVIEVKPDFNTLITEFTIHKGRFELKQGKKISMIYKHGKYLPDSEI